MNNKRLVIPIDKNCKKKNILLQNEKAVPQAIFTNVQQRNSLSYSKINPIKYIFHWDQE